MTALQPVSPERVVDYVASMSWVAALPDDRRADTLARIQAAVTAGETPDALPVHAVIGLTSLV